MLRNLRQKRATRVLDEDTFDQNMSILLSVAEPILINDHNLETFFKLQAVNDVCELLHDHPLPSEGNMPAGKTSR